MYVLLIGQVELKIYKFLPQKKKVGTIWCGTILILQNLQILKFLIILDDAPLFHVEVIDSRVIHLY